MISGLPRSAWFAGGAFLWVAHGVLVSNLFNKRAPQLYMDEPFHVPQTQNYCHGRLDVWDQKITTLPGLYLFGAAYAHGLKGIADAFARAWGRQSISMAVTCSAASLRLSNVLVGWICLTLLYLVHSRLHPGVGALRNTLWAATLATFPLHWFFQFLYYSDVLSLTAVLAAHLACLRRRYVVAAGLAAVATLVRQTNVVWTVFTLGVAVMQECNVATSAGGSLVGNVTMLLRRLSQRGLQVMAVCAPLAAVPAVFVVFVRLNGGIVVGDRSAHVAVPHLVQPMYFALFSAAAMAPTLLNRKRLMVLRDRMAQRPATSLAAFMAAVAVVVAAVEGFTVAHPFLLSDNRHLTFYIWKDLLGVSPWVRRAAAPLYVAAGVLIVSAVAEAQSPLWIAAWVTCTCVVLVPSPLVEFRYFTIPLIMLALHIQPPTVRQTAVAAVAWAAVNAATVWLFLMRPYAWPDGSLARFMW